MTKGFANFVWPEVVRYIESTEGVDPMLLYAHPNITAAHQSIVDQLVGLSVVKVKIYNPTGMTIYSSDPQQVGTVEDDNAGFFPAWSGKIISELTHRDTFNTFDGVIEEQDVLGTYIPIHARGQSSKIVGVIDLYSNVTPLLQRVNNVQQNIIVGVAAILMALYGALVWIVYRAARIIRTQQDTRARAEQELRLQQRTLATFEERERLARELHDSFGQVLGFVKMQSQAALELYVQGQSNKQRVQPSEAPN